MTIRSTISCAAMLLLAGAAVAGTTRVNVIAAEGQTVQGADGLLITTLNAPFTNGLGQVGFTGGLAGPGGTINFVFANDKIVFRSDEVVGMTLTGAEGTMGIGDNGEFIYSPSVDGEDSVWTQDGLLLRAGDAAPGLPGQFSSFNSRPTMSPDGTSHWVGGLSTTSGGSTAGRVLWRDSGGTTSAIFQTGDMIGGFAIGTTGVGFAYDFSDDNNNHIHSLLLDTGSTNTDGFVYVNGSLVAQEASASGAGDNWDNFDATSINNSGNYLFSGDTDGATASDEFIAYNGSIALREGDTVDGVTLGTAVNWASINNNNEAAFLWSLTSSSDEGLFWAADAAELSLATLLLRTGDQVDTDGDNIADATIADFSASNIISPGISLSDHPWVFVEVDLVDLVGAGTEYEAIIRVRVPTPGAATLLAVAGLAGLRRRR